MSEPSLNYHIEPADRLSYSRPLSKWMLPEAEQEDSCHNYSCWWWIFWWCANFLLAQNSTSKSGSNANRRIYYEVEAFNWKMSIWSLQMKDNIESPFVIILCTWLILLYNTNTTTHILYCIIKHIQFEQPSLVYPAVILFILLELNHVPWPRPWGKPITQLNTLNTNAHAHRCSNDLSVFWCPTFFYSHLFWLHGVCTCIEYLLSWNHLGLLFLILC